VAYACHQEIEFAFVQDPLVPAVSVVIPCYGQADYLADAVTSVVGQTFTDWEIVIVDDGSPDDVARVASDLIAAHPQHRIRLLRQPNAGVAAARNAAIETSKGRYILPLDADDEVDPTMLAKTTSLLEGDRRIAIAYTDVQQFGEGGELIQAAEYDPARLPEANQLSYCSLYRREVWEATGGYSPNMTWGHEDWDFWVGAAECGYRARRIPEPLLRYRIRPGTRYADALTHDAEMRRQMRLNHPATYSPSRRLARWLRVVPGTFVRRVSRRLRRMGRTPSSAA
jgi:glycosyltransferase involved in cell wall biosynthesis